MRPSPVTRAVGNTVPLFPSDIFSLGDQISVSGDASALATVQGDAVSHLWIASGADLSTASQISTGTSRFDTNPAWTPDGKAAR